MRIAFTDADRSLALVGLDVTDLFGQTVLTNTLPIQDGRLNTELPLGEQQAAELYIVNVTAGEQRFTERLVIQ